MVCMCTKSYFLKKWHNGKKSGCSQANLNKPKAYNIQHLDKRKQEEALECCKDNYGAISHQYSLLDDSSSSNLERSLAIYCVN